MKNVKKRNSFRKTFLASGATIAILANSVNAVEITPFGKLGAIGNFAFGDNTINNKSITAYMGVTGHLGVDFNFSGFRLGIGAMSGFAPLTLGTNGRYGSNSFVHSGGIYRSPYIDVSDLYVGYSTEGFIFLLGRYNGSKVISNADWIGGYNQGVALAYKSERFSVWATWINDFLRNGYNANANFNVDGRYGMDLAGFGGYSSSWNNFNLNRDLFAVGAGVKLGEYFEFSPFAHYWLFNRDNDYLQVGARLAFSFNIDFVKSKTTFRGLWTNNVNSGHNGVLWQADEELLFLDIIKLGGGYLSVGGIGLNNFTLVDRTRFYGQYLFPYVFDGTGVGYRRYLFKTAETYYVFTGFKLGGGLDLNVLYANGDYKEFSAIINYNILGGSTDNEGGESKFTWSVGGGYVTDNFKSHAILAYTKVKF